jgi:hypothetical protein
MKVLSKMTPSRIDHYIAMSGAADSAGTRLLFNNLLEESRTHLGDRSVDFPSLKEMLSACGFTYAYNVFRADEVLSQRKGNCLGTPLLLGCLAAEFGLNCGFRIIVSPQDAIYNDELTFFEDLKRNTRFDRPELSTKPEQMRWMRFTPLEHMVLEVDGKPFDTTPGESGDLPPYEGERSVSFETALTCVLQDRAATAYNLGDFETARSLGLQVLEQHPDNREVHGLMARVAMEQFDDRSHSHHLAEYRRLGADDSLAQFNQFIMTDGTPFLRAALMKYPAYAEALAYQSGLKAAADPGEARVQFSIASRMYSESVVLELPRFFHEHFRELGMLFGTETMVEILDGLGNLENAWGTFDHHCTLFELTGDEGHRAEAEEAMTTPLQQLKLLRAGSEHTEDISTDLNHLDSCFKDSYLYRDSKARLWGKENHP